MSLNVGVREDVRMCTNWFIGAPGEPGSAVDNWKFAINCRVKPIGTSG